MSLISNIKTNGATTKKWLEQPAKIFFKDYILKSLFDGKLMEYTENLYNNLYEECINLYDDDPEVLTINYNSKYAHVLFNYSGFNPKTLYKQCGIKEIKFKGFKRSYQPINIYLDEYDSNAGTFGDFFRITTEDFNLEYGIRILLDANIHKTINFGKGVYLSNTSIEAENSNPSYIKKLLLDIKNHYKMNRITRPFIGNGIKTDFRHDINNDISVKTVVKRINKPYDGLRNILKKLPAMIPLNISQFQSILLIKVPQDISYEDKKSMVRLYEMQENGIWNGGWLESLVLDGFSYILIEKDY